MIRAEGDAHAETALRTLETLLRRASRYVDFLARSVGGLERRGVSCDFAAAFVLPAESGAASRFCPFGSDGVISAEIKIKNDFKFAMK